MGLSLSIDPSGLLAANQVLQEIQLKVSDISAAAPAIRLLIQEDVDFRFANAPATETGGEVYGGVQWKSLSEASFVQRPYRRGGQLLRDTGELMQSLTAEGHPYNVFSVTSSEIVFGTALAKAGRLQSDRPFIFWHPILVQKIADYLAGWLTL